MNKISITTGQIVTYDFSTENSNTFYVHTVLKGEAILFHPLKPKVFKIVPIDQLNLVPAKLKSNLDRMFDLVHLNEKSLDYENSTIFDMLSYYYIQNRKLSNRQKKNLSDLTGKVAAILLDQDATKAKAIINSEVGLLDSFNLLWYNNLKDTILNKDSHLSEKQKSSIFNMAGFVLAQMAVDKVDLND